ncbi:MAG: hypothetical protein LBO66_00145, partial [Deltaproteobacteria bacterium]|nr:hypothetical protein [Deltaproteobacteria bacterium]
LQKLAEIYLREGSGDTFAAIQGAEEEIMEATLQANRRGLTRPRPGRRAPKPDARPIRGRGNSRPEKRGYWIPRPTPSRLWN